MDTSSKFVWLFTNEHEQVLKKLGSLYKDTCKHTQKKQKQKQKNQENIFMFSDCTARSEPIKYHQND
jgi:hypothetical protein